MSLRRGGDAYSGDFVLEKHIFSGFFEKDIKRVFIYKKAERLAKAVALILPAFAEHRELAKRAEGISVTLIDAAVDNPLQAREAMSRELLALSSILAIARASGALSAMNADIIAKEARNLLEEMAAYEKPRIDLPDIPTLAELSRTTGALSSKNSGREHPRVSHRREAGAQTGGIKGQHKGQAITDTDSGGTRKSAILDVLRSKGPSYIKDISTIVRGVSEKTVQRELAALVREGLIAKEGERRWTVYRLTENL